MPRRVPRPLIARTIARCALFAFALPCVYLGGASAAFFYRHRAANAAIESHPLPAAPASVSSTRLMVFAPHCDDETLGCAGLIQQTVAAGGSVQTVIITNGDAYRTAVETNLRKLHIGPSDYIHFASIRQEESFRALAGLGVEKESVQFLGYPDQGLMALWNDCWMPEHPFTSSYTRCSSSPYANTFNCASRYCGNDLVEDIKTTMRAYRPSVITVTHPAEDHPDHAAAAAFVGLALQELQNDPKERRWATRARIEHYLVHRGDWPLPQGSRLNEPLLPPAEMARCDTHWESLSLTTLQTEQKNRSIALYPSQTALMGTFLVSFARRSELYGEIDTVNLPTVPDGTIRVDADPKDWERLPPMLIDPVRDNVLRDMQGGGDLRALYACRDTDTLFLRIDTRQPISSRISYTVRLRAFGPHGETGAKCFILAVSHGEAQSSPKSELQFAIRDRHLEAAVQWSQLEHDLGGQPLTWLSVSAETSLAGVNIDRTGSRLLRVSGHQWK